MKRIVSVFMAALMAALMFCFTVFPVSAAEEFSASCESEYCSITFDDESAYLFFNSAFPSVPETDFPFLNYIDTDTYFILGYDCYSDSNNLEVYCLLKSHFFDFTFSYYGPSSTYHHLYFSNNVSCIVYRFNVLTSSVTLQRRSSSPISLSLDLYNDGRYKQFYFNKSILNNNIVHNYDYDNDYSGLGIDVESFFNWYMSTNDRYKNQLYGVEQGSNFKIFDDNLKYLLDYFNEYGVDLSSFYSHYSKLLPCYKNPDFVGPPSKNDFINLFTILKQHYNFYLKSKSMYLPTVKPNVTEDDTTLITDIDVDTVDISLLREILRTLILTYNSVNDVDYDLSSYIFNMYLKMDDLVTDIDVNFTALRSDLSLHFDSLADKIGISVANNINPSLKSIDNSVNALAVPLTDIDADLNANLDVANNIDANLEANLQAVNNIDGSINNLDVSLKEINNSVSGGSGGCCSGSGSGSSVEAPEVPDFDFDTLKDGMGNFLDFFVWVCDHLPPSITVLMGAALSVAIYCRICAR